MLRLDLMRLGREGSIRIEARIPSEDPLWQNSEVPFAGPVGVDLRATHAGSGEVVVRGTVEGDVQNQCRRCLREVPGHIRTEVTLVFSDSSAEGEEDDGDVRFYDERAGDLDLSKAVREEVVLAIDQYVVCDLECRGLCARCGADLNTEPCTCPEEEADPRWDALRALKKE
jgi:uncharacterized protein